MQAPAVAAPYKPLADTLVIGIGHKSRHGKDSAARFIIEAYPGVDIQRFGFADALKAVCRVEHGMTTKDGLLLQQAGVARRLIDPDVWVRALYYTVAERRPAVALITDMRFPNEAGMIASMGGYVVKVERRHQDGRLFRTTDRDPDHESETALDSFTDWDALIDNPEGDLDSFRANTLNIFRQLTLELEDAQPTSRLFDHMEGLA